MRSSGEHRRLGQNLAALIISQLVAKGLPQDSVLGTEAELLRGFGVSRGTFREALRQLEWQGVVKAYRGAGGGLRVSRPSGFVPMFMLKVYFELARMDQVAMRQALRALQRAMEHPANTGGNEILALLTRAVDGQFVAAIDRRQERAGRSPKLSERVAYRLTLEIEDRDLKPGDALGRESELIERMKIGRGVLREALNLMELNGFIETRRGAGGGIYVGEPSADFTIYVARVHLALASTDGTVASAQRLLLDACEEAGLAESCEQGPGNAMAAAARTFADRTHNPVLQILMRIFERYWENFRPEV